MKLNFSLYSSILTIIITIIIFSYYNANGEQSPDIFFKVNNASSQSVDDHEIIIKINNMPTNKEICKSGDCSIEIIKFNEYGVSTANIFLPTPGIQDMHSGVDFRLHDTAYNNLSETERSLQERWNIWGNCAFENIQDTEFICEKDTSDTITLSNQVQDINLILPLIFGKYDPKSDIMIFTANFN
jgi:hypothetical protein